MRINERKDEIIRILSNADYVTVDEFSRQLGVSKVTIRSDLSELEQRGLLFRTHGGAMIPEHNSSVRVISDTLKEYAAEKHRIAKAASELIESGSTVIIDSGSTTVNMVNYLSEKNITMVTNSLLAVDVAKQDPTIEVIMLGGSLRRYSMGFIGPMSTLAVSQIHADIMFLGSSGYTNDSIYCTNLIEGEIKKEMMKVSDKVVFLADSSKYGKKAFSSLSIWDDIDVFVTDYIEPSLKDRLSNRGVEVIVAGGEEK